VSENRYPRGKLNPADEGETQLAVAVEWTVRGRSVLLVVTDPITPDLLGFGVGFLRGEAELLVAGPYRGSDRVLNLAAPKPTPSSS